MRILSFPQPYSITEISIQWLLAQNAVATVTPTFRTAADIDEWAAHRRCHRFQSMNANGLQTFMRVTTTVSATME
jgi:aryl-alcohol dehydrogenase-like predicted oxidoreductase